ncbi:60S ribosome subunit biogenesis protein NIP7 -like protein [Trichinella murrelli]|uniref:60S ribosome subunit biogenesis protein NIP7 homolog n=1 Tax=Trichinella murrelli TaxID=144512 RepID=A0A0V0U334_9BILA|nr:60S ribosome subunit biogenesis protein NIP7 -like protein [Trichinella murrelli]
MRPLTEEEMVAVLKKLLKFVGDNIRQLIKRSDGIYVFRLHKDRVYYSSEALMKRATAFSMNEIIAFGTCIGKFTKTKKFHLTITALDIIVPYCKCKVWVKANAEQSFLYGNHILKAGVGRITDDVEPNAGIIVYNMTDMPLGFGIASKSTSDIRKSDSSAVAVINIADIGQYVRDEQHII